MDNWHIKYLCDELQSVAERVFKREPKLYDLIINMPPSSSKTSIVNIYFPLWCWINDFTLQFINISYSHHLSTAISEKCRDIMRSDKFQTYFYENIKKIAIQAVFLEYKRKGDWWFSLCNQQVTIGGIHGHFINLDDPKSN